MPRIAPLEPPYEADVEQALAPMMPPGVPPILLFRTFANNLPMTTAMQTWGSYELSRNLSLSMRDREILIDRTCARCRCEYEWGVHVTFFADRVGLTQEQNASLVRGGPADPCWDCNRDRLLIQAADELHETSTLSDALWGELSKEFAEAELLDLMLLCGWYHAISYVGNAAKVDREAGSPRFTDY